MRFAASRRADPHIDMTPMIDIVFQLVLFFMVSTTFIDAPGIEVDLPQASANTVLTEKNDLNVWVTSDGAIFINGDAVNREQLTDALQETAEDNPDTLVIIKADAGVEHGRVVQVMDLAQEKGLSRLAIATEEGQGGGEPGD